MSLKLSEADLTLFTLGSYVQGQRRGPARKDGPSHYPSQPLVSIKDAAINAA